MNDSVVVDRHSLLYRVLHWLIVAEVMLLLLSGVGVSDYLQFSLFGRGPSRSFHIVLGLAWMSTITLFVYYFILSGEYKWFGLSRLGHAVDFFVHEIKCFVSGSHIRNPISYSVKEERYVEKIMPTEVLAWWGWFLLWLTMVISGLALLFPENFSFFNRIFHFVIPAFERSVSATRFVHLAVSSLIVVYIIVHAYAAWSFGMMGSMISGKKDEPVAPSGGSSE